DHYCSVSRLLLNGGVHEDRRLLSQRSLKRMTPSCITVEQLARGGPILDGQGWGYGMSVVTSPDDVSAVPGRYGWNGGYGTYWFNDPTRRLVAIAMTQTTDVIFNGAMTEFAKLAIGSYEN